VKAFIVGMMRESAAGSAAASRIGRINRFMGPHIHNLAIVAILSETGGSPATGDALRARGGEAARFVRGGLRFLDSAAGGPPETPGQAAPNTCAGSIAGVRRAGFRCS
jgi:hypothetical protein